MPTDELIQRDLAVLWHPCAQMSDYRGPDGFAPLHIVSARGSRLHLADGRQIIDAISSWWCKSLGHGHPKLKQALIAQARAFEHVILANTTNEPVVRLCERLLTLANGSGPGAQEPRGQAEEGMRPQPATRPLDHSATPFAKVFLADNGSTGMEIALKLALHAQKHLGRPQRTHFAFFENGYHGETVGTLSVGDCGLYGDPYRPLFFPATRLTGLPYRLGPEDPLWMDASAEWPGIEAQLNTLASTLAGIVYEPVLQGAGGMRLYSPDLLPRLRAWADVHEVLLIADEIAAGFGRCGAMLASHLGSGRVAKWPGGQVDEAAGTPSAAGALGHSTTSPLPHLAVVSKGLTGGFLPLSAVLIPDAIYDLFEAPYAELRGFMHSNTYTGNALAVAVANASLDVFEQDDILGRIARLGPRLRGGLARLARTRPYLHNVRGVGFMAAADIRQPDGTPLDWRQRTGYQVYRQAVARGVLLRPIGDTLYLFPPFTTPRQDIGTMIRVMGESLDAVLAG